jgi:hypothetical protein
MILFFCKRKCRKRKIEERKKEMIAKDRPEIFKNMEIFQGNWWIIHILQQ